MIRSEKLELLKKYSEELKVVQKHEIDEKKNFLKINSYQIKLNNGKEFIREQLIKGNNLSSAVIIVPILKNGEILTIVEPRVFTKETVGIGFPAGYIEVGEQSSIAALRELKEETGYVPNNLIKMDEAYQDEGISSGLNKFYIAFDCEKKYDQQLDGDEQIKYLTLTLDELIELEKKNYIKSLNCKFALNKAKEYVKGR